MSPSKLKPSISCIPRPAYTDIAIFECSFCDKLSTYDQQWESGYHDQIGYLYFDHTHFSGHDADGHAVLRVAVDGKVYQAECDWCRVYYYIAFYIYGSCDRPSVLARDALANNFEDEDYRTFRANWGTGPDDPGPCSAPLDSSWQLMRLAGKSALWRHGGP